MVIDRNNPGTVADAINNELADMVSTATTGIRRPCPTCKSPQLMTKRTRIDSAPEYMLARFKPVYNATPPPVTGPVLPPRMRKITDHDEFPQIEEVLDLTQCQVNTSASLRYRLVAVLPHHGTIGHGHWIATVRSYNNGVARWPRRYSINDEHVITVGSEFVLGNPESFNDKDSDEEEDGEDDEEDEDENEEFQVVVLMYARIH